MMRGADGCIFRLVGKDVHASNHEWQFKHRKHRPTTNQTVDEYYCVFCLDTRTIDVFPEHDGLIAS